MVMEETMTMNKSVPAVRTREYRELLEELEEMMETLDTTSDLAAGLVDNLGKSHPDHKHAFVIQELVRWVAFRIQEELASAGKGRRMREKEGAR
jgi:hypothetical protein